MSNRTTLRLAFMSRMTLSSTTKQEIVSNLEDDTAAIARLRAERTPIVRVTVRELVAPTVEPQQLARGTAMAPVTYRDVGTVPLYDLRDVGRVDVIRVGRHPDQDIQVLDMIVSREHGLVLYEGHTFYHDYGTLLLEEDREDGRPAGRSGSRNGSFVNGRILVQNGLVPWMQEDTIHIGTETKHGHAFQLAYVHLPRPTDN